MTLPRALLAALVASQASASASFYVSSSGGNDENSGSSPGSPWKTLDRAFSAPLAPGDAVLLREGDTWELSTSLNVTGLSGTADAPITMSAYADGADVQDRPIVARAAGANQTGILLNFHNSAGLNVSGVEFVGAEVGLGFTFDAAAAPPPQGGYSNFTIEDCVFRLQRGVYYTPSSGSWWGSAIAFAREGGVGVTASSVRVAHCAFVGCDQAYTNNLPQPSFPPDEWTRAFVDGLDVSGGVLLCGPVCSHSCCIGAVRQQRHGLRQLQRALPRHDDGRVGARQRLPPGYAAPGEEQVGGSGRSLLQLRPCLPPRVALRRWYDRHHHGAA